MIDSTDAGYLRRWAMQCFEQANNSRASGEERARLMKMRNALLTLAGTQDWLSGKGKSPSDEGQEFLGGEATPCAALDAELRR